MPANMIAAQRLYFTADKKKLVAENSKDAAFLYVAPGDEIPADVAERFKLKDGKLPTSTAKESKEPENKGGKAPANKGGKAPANKEQASPADKADAEGGAK